VKQSLVVGYCSRLSLTAGV